MRLKNKAPTKTPADKPQMFMLYGDKISKLFLKIWADSRVSHLKQFLPSSEMKKSGAAGLEEEIHLGEP